MNWTDVIYFVYHVKIDDSEPPGAMYAKLVRGVALPTKVGTLRYVSTNDHTNPKPGSAAVILAVETYWPITSEVCYWP